MIGLRPATDPEDLRSDLNPFLSMIEELLGRDLTAAGMGIGADRHGHLVPKLPQPQSGIFNGTGHDEYSMYKVETHEISDREQDTRRRGSGIAEAWNTSRRLDHG